MISGPPHTVDKLQVLLIPSSQEYTPETYNRRGADGLGGTHAVGRLQRPQSRRSWATSIPKAPLPPKHEQQLGKSSTPLSVVSILCDNRGSKG